jgi:hypothetical protein
LICGEIFDNIEVEVVDEADGYVAKLNPITLPNSALFTTNRGILVVVGNPVPESEYKPDEGLDHPEGKAVGVAAKSN